MHEPIVVLDLETTGLDCYRDEIIEFAAWRIEDGKPVRSLVFCVRPRHRVPAKVLKLTGITEAELQLALPIAHYREEIKDFLKGAIIAGHNISFDLSFLERAIGAFFPAGIWDTLELARIFFPALPNHRLSTLADKLNLNESSAPSWHRAGADAWAAWKLLEACWDYGSKLDQSFFDQAAPLLEEWSGRSFIQALHKHIIRTFPDRPIRTGLILAESPAWFEEKPKSRIPEDRDWVIGCFTPGGILEQSLNGYESRSGQVKMAEAVTSALTGSGHAVIEAGTGTGKSLAYLIPALWWARTTGKKVVVATHTIPLQEQLYAKDLPLLRQALPFPFQSALLKGRGNYLCLKKWTEHLGTISELPLEERLASLSILSWLRQTVSGDVQELARFQGIDGVWQRVGADTDGCYPKRCPYSGICFLLRARKQAEEADVIVVNHSLLFSDMRADYNVLPEHQYLVVDEAHHFQEVALEQMAVKISLEQIKLFLDKLYRQGGGGFIAHLKSRLRKHEEELPDFDWISFNADASELPELGQAVLAQAFELFEFLKGIIGSEQTLRLTAEQRRQAWWEVFAVQAENLRQRLQGVSANLDRIVSLLAKQDVELLEESLYELGGNCARLQEFIEVLSLIFEEDTLERVDWLERFPSLCLKSSPVEVSAILAEKIFSRLETAVLTSATISIAGDFSHFLRENGLPLTTRTLKVESPFDYERQMRFYVVKDLHEGVNLSGAQVAHFISSVVERMRGRTLVLFTSHLFLRETHGYLTEFLEHSGVEVLGQGIDGGRKSVLEQFLANPQSVLLGANSFWEGIDIPGDPLSCVIMVKLPFWPPTLPLIEARSELLSAQGHNAFREYLLPEAVIRFKQGFGRLIRSKADRGIVILLDARVIHKSYGSVFLSSLPLLKHVRAEREQVLAGVESWLENSLENAVLS
ncbi:helicase C-terminal domain-containing protein [Paradesulfitobacterium ferrireducens]|uniref:helicase C-terminal domain-containing protein n=1 Tax=Paradesulfitobacterium ferrireducens TaxID=2816476 RepID=UPI001A8C7F26|nr:helicase C-terminal domain-containing protein [Paradesulfitobacterium ferrireducens]